MGQARPTPANSDPKSATALGKSERHIPTASRLSANLSESPEPDLVMLLDEPEVRLLMHADNVDERELMAMLNAVRTQMRANSATKQHDKAQNSDDYRPGVGIVLLNGRGEIFIGRRADVQNDAWQMPQGGIEDGETPQEAAVRELKEEIGTNSAEIIAESRDWLFYEVPEELAQKAWAGRWKGQRQKWFVMLYKGIDSEIDLATEHAEFNAWRWIPPQELTELAVSFKRRLYLNIIGEFATIFRD